MLWTWKNWLSHTRYTAKALSVSHKLRIRVFWRKNWKLGESGRLKLKDPWWLTLIAKVVALEMLKLIFHMICKNISHIGYHIWKFRHGQNSSECLFIWPHLKAVDNRSSYNFNNRSDVQPTIQTILAQTYCCLYVFALKLNETCFGREWATSVLQQSPGLKL